MSAYNIVVNDVEKLKNQVLCLVRIDNYKNMLKHVSIGESIKSDPIQMNFHDSIGKSSLIFMYYPKGQFIGSNESNVMGSGRASLYIRMVNCENKTESLATVVKVFIKSPYSDFNDEFATTKFATLSYCDLNQRWIGPLNLDNINELYSKRCKNLFLNDSLTIGCELNDTTFRTKVPRPMIETRSSSDNVQGLNSSVVGSELNCAPRLHSKKGTRHSEGSYDSNAKADEAKGNNQKKNVGRRSSSVFQKDVMKENENQNICRCAQPERKISRETQTWDERLLRTCNKDLSSKEAESEKAALLSYRNNGHRVKDAIEFFEKRSTSRN